MIPLALHHSLNSPEVKVIAVSVTIEYGYPKCAKSVVDFEDVEVVTWMHGYLE